MTADDNAVLTDPGDELVFANDRIRVWAMNLEPGESIFYHSHQHDIELVGLSVSDTEQIAESNGKGEMSRLHKVIDPSDYVDPEEHRTTSAWPGVPRES